MRTFNFDTTVIVINFTSKAYQNKLMSFIITFFLHETFKDVITLVLSDEVVNDF